MAGPDDAEDLAVQIDVIPAGPASRLQFGGLKVRALGERQHEAEGVLGHDRRSLTRDVADRDRPLPRHREVERVGADPADGSHAKMGQGAQGFGRPLHRAACVHQAHRILRTRDPLLERARAIGMHDHLPVGLEPLELGRALDLRRVVPGRDDDNGRANGHPGLLSCDAIGSRRRSFYRRQ